MNYEHIIDVASWVDEINSLINRIEESTDHFDRNAYDILESFYEGEDYKTSLENPFNQFKDGRWKIGAIARKEGYFENGSVQEGLNRLNKAITDFEKKMQG